MHYLFSFLILFPTTFFFCQLNSLPMGQIILLDAQKTKRYIRYHSSLCRNVTFFKNEDFLIKYCLCFQCYLLLQKSMCCFFRIMWLQIYYALDISWEKVMREVSTNFWRVWSVHLCLGSLSSILLQQGKKNKNKNKVIF